LDDEGQHQNWLWLHGNRLPKSLLLECEQECVVGNSRASTSPLGRQAAAHAQSIVDRKFVSDSPAEAATYSTRPDVGASPISLHQDSDVVPDHDNVLSGSPTNPDVLLQRREPADRASITSLVETESPVGFKTEDSPQTPQGTRLLLHAFFLKILQHSKWWKGSHMHVAVYVYLQSLLPAITLCSCLGIRQRIANVQ
jgi:hypothetical protein